MEKNSDGINSWTDFKRSTIAEEIFEMQKV